MNRYELRLKLQFLESFEISEVDNFSMDEVHSAAGSAYDLLEDFCKENNINLIEIGEYYDDACTSCGYYGEVPATIETSFTEKDLRNKLERLRRTVDYCDFIGIEEIHL